MNEHLKSSESPEFFQRYPYLSEENDRLIAHDNTQDLSYADAMRILREANMPYVRVTPSRMGGDTYLDIDI